MNKAESIELLHKFDSPPDTVVLKSDDQGTLVIEANSIENNPDVEVSIQHTIDYQCKMLNSESHITEVLCLLYCGISVLWIYRNKYHYPNTMTVLHRLLSVPPVVKFILMVANFYMFYLCPWKNIDLKIYVILVKILLNLIYESITVGIFFLIAMGYKIAK